jgi:hypothetical protein
MRTTYPRHRTATPAVPVKRVPAVLGGPRSTCSDPPRRPARRAPPRSPPAPVGDRRFEALDRDGAVGLEAELTQARDDHRRVLARYVGEHHVAGRLDSCSGEDDLVLVVAVLAASGQERCGECVVRSVLPFE